MTTTTLYLRPSAALLLALVVGCAGASRGSGGDDEGAGGTSGSKGTPTGGSGIGGSSTGGTMPGGTSGMGGSYDCGTIPFSERPAPCVQNCSTDPALAAPPLCVNGRFVCPEGTFEAKTCPDAACARRFDWECCDHATGTVEAMACSADGAGLLPCAGGTEQRVSGDYCIPNGIDVATCKELDGQTCSQIGLECHQGKGCDDTFCICATFPDLETSWTCQTILCSESD